MEKRTDIPELIGKTFNKVYQSDGSNLKDLWQNSGECIVFESDSSKVIMFHEQNSCESVYIKQIDGDLSDLEGVEILQAEEYSYSPESVENDEDRYFEDSSTYTFYRLSTSKGYVTIQWHGSSNGYYSESVEIRELSNE